MVDLLNILKTKNKLLYGAGAFVNRASALFLKTNSQKKNCYMRLVLFFMGLVLFFLRSVPPIKRDLFLQ